MSIRDVTERKEQERALKLAKAKAEEATETKSMFLANMSHEIRTPMNAILNMTGLALEADLPPKPQQFINVAHSSARNLLGILNDILDFSKIEADKLELEIAPFSLQRGARGSHRHIPFRRDPEARRAHHPCAAQRSRPAAR